MNYAHGKISLGTNGVTYAPDYLVTETAVIASPTRSDYLANGWKAIVDVPPTCDDAHYAEPTGWTEEAETITRTYTIRDVVIPPRHWTPLSIKRACADKWAAVRDALTAAGIYEDFVMAQEIIEDDAAFAQGYAWAVATYGKEAVDAILAAAEVA